MRDVRDRIEWLEQSNGGNCFFFALVPLLAAVITDIVPALGVGLIGGVTGASAIAGGLIGAGGGALLGGLTGGGKGALEGAITGGITGGALSFAPALGSAISGITGIGAETAGTIADVVAGAGGGVLGSVVTGQSPLTGLETGGAAGLAAGLTSGIGGNAPTSGTAGTSPQGVSPSGVGPSVSPATVSTPAASLSAASPASGAAFGDIGDTISGTDLGGQTTGIGTAGPTGGPTGGITTGTGAGSTAISAPSAGGAASISGAAPDLSIGPTAASQAATLGGLTSPVTPGYAATGDITSPTGVAYGPTGGVDALQTAEDKLGNLFSTKNLLGAAVGGLGLIQQLGSKSTEQQQIDQLQDASASATSMERALTAPLFSGVLPQGAQAALTESQANQIGQIRSAYAAMGMSGSTGESDAINAVYQGTAAQQYSIEENLFSQAYPYAQLAGTEEEGVIGAQQTMDQNFSNALARFAAAITGSTAGTPTPA